MSYDYRGIQLPESVAEWLADTVDPASERLSLPWAYNDWLVSANGVQVRIVKRQTKPPRWQQAIPDPATALASFDISGSTLIDILYEMSSKQRERYMAICHSQGLIVILSTFFLQTMVQMWASVHMAIYQDRLSIATENQCALIMGVSPQSLSYKKLAEKAKATSRKENEITLAWEYVDSVFTVNVPIIQGPVPHFEPFDVLKQQEGEKP